MGPLCNSKGLFCIYAYSRLAFVMSWPLKCYLDTEVRLFDLRRCCLVPQAAGVYVRRSFNKFFEERFDYDL
jgi:hypothetical protein